MHISVSGTLFGGLGFFGRFIVAFAIIVLLKFKNKNDKELDRGLKLLVIFGVAALLLVLVVIGCWFAFFGAPYSMLPYFFGYYHY